MGPLERRRRTVAEAVRKQEQWRRKQIRMLFETGRPIFPGWKDRVQSPIVFNSTEFIYKYYR
jgi:hypothetical protein